MASTIVLVAPNYACGTMHISGTTWEDWIAHEDARTTYATYLACVWLWVCSDFTYSAPSEPGCFRLA